MRVLVTHPSTQNSFYLAAELYKRRALSGFYTSVAFSSIGIAGRIWQQMPARWRARLHNRRVVGVPSERLHSRPLSELIERWNVRRGVDRRLANHRRKERFQKSIPDHALTTATAVIGFDTASWILSKRCAAHGIPFLLDRSTPHPDAKLAAYELVRAQYPDWDVSSEARRPEVRHAEQEEHDNASIIVAGSSFVQRTLIECGVPVKKICVNPYGVDCERFKKSPHTNSRPFRFLFAGPINARKGLPLLIDAWRTLAGRGAELWRIGSGSDEDRKRIPQLTGLQDLGRMPDAAEVMRQCDVFVLPTYFEGFALVILEAMASGLPVITTTASGAEGVIAEGEEGWLLERGDLVGLIEKMNYCLENRDVIREMGRKARFTAENYSWHAYGNRWMQTLTELCGTQEP